MSLESLQSLLNSLAYQIGSKARQKLIEYLVKKLKELKE